MKVAHFVYYGPRQAGMYETARDLCAAECALGVDAKLVDTAWVDSKTEPPDTFRLDRGVDVATMKWAQDADIHVLHSRIPDSLFKSKPAVIVLHGTPEYCFYSELINHEKGDRNFSTLLAYGEEECVKKFVTLWPRHVEFWKAILGSDRLACIEPPVQNCEYTPDGARQEFKNPSKFNVGFCDSWRITAFKDPFRILVGFRKFWQKHPEAKIHLFGIPSSKKRDVVWDRYINALRKHGDFIGDLWERHSDMASVYRALDVVITPVTEASRIVREALSCGTPLVTPYGSSCDDYTCDMTEPENVAKALEEVYKDLKEQKGFVAKKCVTKAREFEAEKSAKKFIDILNKIREEALCEAS